MKRVLALTVMGMLATAAWAQSADGPTDPKAQKTYENARDWLKRRDYSSALDDFKKADKQDGGHCVACQHDIIKYGLRIGDFKAADAATQEMIADAKDQKSAALAHEERAVVLYEEAGVKNKDDIYAESDKEYKAALAAYPTFPEALYGDGLVLAHLKQDDAAKAQFERFVSMTKENSPQRQRAQRYAERPELARLRMAPAFAVTTVDGTRVSLDGLQGKVVLIDFWATWCGPCREALPRIQKIAQKFEGQPLLILSVSLDNDEQKWKDFIAKNNMTWLQYRDRGSDESLAHLFNVNAIPHTFTIDADGVLQDEHIGDEAIEGKLRKLCTRARELQEAPKTMAKAGQ
jgi:thiol-disulfide isomerase/thioredoxin/outer membrane protein assembly factor BamD (BamD/ComL family)